MAYVNESHLMVMRQLASQRQLNIHELTTMYELAYSASRGGKINLPPNRLSQIAEKSAIVVNTETGLSVRLEGELMTVGYVVSLESFDAVRSVGSTFIAPNQRPGY